MFVLTSEKSIFHCSLETKLDMKKIRVKRSLNICSNKNIVSLFKVDTGISNKEE